MKVGTDGVLLGAWTPVNGAQKILDVGTGTGLVALMLAQRSTAIIDAVELDGQAYEEAKLNFGRSKWGDRLTAVHSDFKDLAVGTDARYDLIVSNPPYFISSMKTNDPAVTMARHTDSLSFDQLINGSQKILTDGGRLCVVVPMLNCVDIKEHARLSGFYLRRQTSVAPKTGKGAKRVLLEFSLDKCYPTYNDIVILNGDGSYTDLFRSLTAPFYLTF